ncbi:MAG: ParB/RepB/Spo0J family partition protein [Opitutaceae bacterium]|nr:ParB/RepB/Spo0J family partition protein [Cytophagales bacterium]
MSDNKKKPAMGRGLSALLSDATPVESPVVEKVVEINSISEIPIDQIEANAGQPRTYFDEDALIELAESIKVQGIIQPITVRKLSEKEFQIISGERRFRASKLLGLTSIPAYVRTADDQQMLEMALIENIQRENLNAIEISLSYQRLLSECNLKQEELGTRVGKNRTTVNNYLRLLKLPPAIQASIRDNKLSMGHARAIINVEKTEDQLAIFNKVLNEDLSVRKVEDIVRAMSSKEEKPSAKAKSPENIELKQLQGRLSSHFGTRISISSDEKLNGEIKIPFISKDDLNRILEIINP